MLRRRSVCEWSSKFRQSAGLQNCTRWDIASWQAAPTHWLSAGQAGGPQRGAKTIGVLQQDIVGMRLEKDKTEGQSVGVEMRGMTRTQNIADMLLFGL